MTQVSKHPVAPKVEEKVYEIFVDSVKNVRTSDQVVSLLNDLLTKTEKTMLAKRIAIAFLLLKGDYTYRDISKVLRVSKGTIAKVHTILAVQGEGYRKAIVSTLRRQAMKEILLSLVEGLTPVPGKGRNKAQWYKERKKRRREIEEPF